MKKKKCRLDKRNNIQKNSEKNPNLITKKEQNREKKNSRLDKKNIIPFRTKKEYLTMI